MGIIRALIVTVMLVSGMVAQERSGLGRLRTLPNSAPDSGRAAAGDIAAFDRDMRLAAPYFATLRPGDYPANRDLVRRMAVYLMGARVLARDPEMWRAVGNAQRTFDSLGLASWYGAGLYGVSLLPQSAPGTEQAPEQVQREPVKPPFPLDAPKIEGLADADRDLAMELTGRYDAAASRAVAAWQNADGVRTSLARDGASLNAVTEAGLQRLQADFNAATADLLSRAWDEARSDLDRAEYETEKIFKAVGR